MVLVDGYICGVAALTALCAGPLCLPKYLLLTHESAESGAPALMAALHTRGCALPAPLRMGLRLGEGTGALLCVPMLRAACAVLADMGSLDQTLAL